MPFVTKKKNILVEHEPKIKSVEYLIILRKIRKWWTTHLFWKREN